MMTSEGKLKAGRKWRVDARGVPELRRTYRVVLEAPYLPVDGEAVTFPGVPAIGSAHPLHRDLVAASYDVEEGAGSDKCVLTVTVNYARQTIESGAGEEGAELVLVQVERWGWDSGVDERELTTAIDGTAVLNSAGDPFESVPTVSVPAPTFAKVMRLAERQAGWQAHHCCVNKSPVVIGGVTFAPRTLLCQIAEERILGDAVWNYRYTVQLRYRTNKVKVAGDHELTEIGWDVAVVDAGMREKTAEGDLVLIRVPDAETGQMCSVSSPELLNGAGTPFSRDGGAPEPYVFRFRAYEEVDFPAMFYSEPALVVGGGS